MTWEKAPWALDGANMSSALARLAEHAALGGAEGVITASSLKVSPLSTPGNGIQIAAGGASVRNYYLGSDPDQIYVVRNVGTETLGSTQMPASNASARSHLVVVSVGDPEFSQVGHPWMKSTDPAAGTETTFQYVRSWVIPNVGAGIQHFYELGLNYPAVELARLDMPANTTTVNAGNIVDLRNLARPRATEEVLTVAGASNNLLNGNGTPGVFENWPNTAHWTVTVPTWAKTLKVMGYVEGTILTKAGNGQLRVEFANGGATTSTNMIESGSTGRRAYNVGGKIDIPASYRGTSQVLQMRGTVGDTASKGFLDTDQYASAVVSIRFEEGAI